MKFTPRISRQINWWHILFEFFAIFCVVFLTLMGVKNLSTLPSSIALAGGISFSISAVHMVIHVWLDGYSSSWKFFSFEDGKKAIISILYAVLVVGLFLYSSIPTTGWAMVLSASISGVIGPRFLTRLVHSHNLSVWPKHHQLIAEQTRADIKLPQKLLMIGFGDHVADFIRSQSRAGGDFEIIGVVHINTECEAASLRGVPIIGSIDRLGAVIRKSTLQGNRPDILVLTRDEMSTRSVGEILSLTDKFDIPVTWLPRSDRINSNLDQQLRPIKLDDLLPRSANLFDAPACGEMMNGSTVLVTGAGGSIGSELVRQISQLQPGTVVLTDSSEHALYTISQEIRGMFPNLNTVSKLLDVRDRGAVFRTMENLRPRYVFHAAALKHVPIVEAQACEGVITNVIGSQNVADAAAANKVNSMVMVSTDKAVNPANVMGATKRLAEAYCQAMDASTPSVKGVTRYVTVRFGNVLGSSGSVVPLFQKQLAQGGPLTVTHKDVERFFMTIPEASRLILQALLLGADGSKGDRGIFVLDMGKPVKIVDLARQVIRLSGLTPEKDIKIVYTGLRPGEKLYEELMHETENLVPTEHPSLLVARPRFVRIQTIRSQIDVIRAAAVSGDSAEVLRLLKLYIPEFEATAREARFTIEKKNSMLRPEAI